MIVRESLAPACRLPSWLAARSRSTSSTTGARLTGMSWAWTHARRGRGADRELEDLGHQEKSRAPARPAHPRNRIARKKLGKATDDEANGWRRPCGARAPVIVCWRSTHQSGTLCVEDAARELSVPVEEVPRWLAVRLRRSDIR